MPQPPRLNIDSERLHDLTLGVDLFTQKGMGARWWLDLTREEKMRYILFWLEVHYGITETNGAESAPSSGPSRRFCG